MPAWQLDLPVIGDGGARLPAAKIPVKSGPDKNNTKGCRRHNAAFFYSEAARQSSLFYCPNGGLLIQNQMEENHVNCNGKRRFRSTNSSC